MKLRSKIIVLSAIPVLGAIGAIGGIVAYQTQRLADVQARVVEDAMMGSRRAELQHYVGLALTSIAHLHAAARDDDTARSAAKDILRAMNYGTDGYFFVYDMHGTNIVHPRKPELEGKNIWEHLDPAGLPVIQALTARAREGGGFQQYLWEKPSSGAVTPKLGYAVRLEHWDWMLGTGIYLDDVQAAVATVRADVDANVRATMWALVAVAVAAVMAVFGGGLALTVSEQRIADGKLKLLAQRIVTSQEEERARLARELHDGISQLLVSIKYQFELLEYRLTSGHGAPVTDMKKELSSLSAVIVEIRRISHALRPSVLDNLGLPAALGQSADEFRHRTGIACRMHLQSGRPLQLEESQAVTLFRIAQEALMNVERHAHARNVLIELARTARSVRLRVADDGRGFVIAGLDGSAAGIGLRNIRERVEQQEGKFTLRSEPGRTELVVELPAAAAHGLTA